MPEKNATQEKKYLNEKEVSERYGLSLSRLRADRFYRRGLPYHKFSRSCLYRVADIESCLKSHRIDTTSFGEA
jgi:hypothetical protein